MAYRTLEVAAGIHSSLAFTLPTVLAAAYPEHFSAIGANAIAIYDAANVWVQDVSCLLAGAMLGSAG